MPSRGALIKQRLGNTVLPTISPRAKIPDSKKGRHLCTGPSS